ncbi:sulfite exporter TauE/SafE family protein [Halobacteriales archaeon Cl-PHB]
MLASAVVAVSAGTVTANADLLVFLVVGLLAGAHCLGMCGPLVSVYADRVAQQSDARRDDTLTLFEVRQHLLFNFGRTLGYAAVGALFGLLGGAVFTSVDGVAPLGDGVRGVTGVLVGLFILAAGVSYLFRGTHDSVPANLPGVSRLFGAVSQTLTRHVDRIAGSPRIVGLGTIHAVLPCPIIYPAYLYAFAIGDPLRGGLSLAVLGLGTIPTLLAYGTMIGTLSVRKRVTLHRGLGAAFLVLGYLPLSHGLMLLGIHLPHVPVPYYQPLA